MKAQLLTLLFLLLVFTGWGHVAAQTDAAATADVAAPQTDVAPIAEAAIQAVAANQPLLDATAQLVDPSTSTSAPQPTDAPLGLAVADVTAQAAQCVPPQGKEHYCSGRCSATVSEGGCFTEVPLSLTSAAAGVGPVTGRRGKPGRPGVDDPPPLGATPLTCDVGGAPSTRMKYTDTAQPKHFEPENFRHSCLGDAAYNCDDPHNSADASDPKKSCCSCFLYAKYCSGAQGHYVQDKALQVGTSHVLVMPVNPCSGVERWQSSNCGRDSSSNIDGIWNKAQSVIDLAVQSGIIKDRSLWGMAINPVSKRGQHQMHIHIAMVSPSLHAAITYGHYNQGATDFYLDCGPNPVKGTTRLTKCTFSTQKSATGDHPHVKIVQAATAGAAEPFFHAYGKQMDNKNPNLLETSTLVLRVPFTNSVNPPYWAIVRNFNGAAECFFEPHGDESLENACKVN